MPNPAHIMALAVASLAGNKMESLTWYKGLILLVVMPVAAFFVPDYAYFFAHLLALLELVPFSHHRQL